MTDAVRQRRPVRLPLGVLEALFPPPALLAGRLAASSVALYTRDCGAYVAFCGYDSAVALRAETLRRWRTHLVQDTPMSPQTINRMLAAVKWVVKEGLVHGLVAREVARIGFSNAILSRRFR